jgi:hypothetical protein
MSLWNCILDIGVRYSNGFSYFSMRHSWLDESAVNISERYRCREKKYSLPLYLCAIVLRRSKHAAPLIRMKSCIPYTNLQCMHNTTKYPYPAYTNTPKEYIALMLNKFFVSLTQSCIFPFRNVRHKQPNVIPILRRPFPEPHQTIHDPFFILRPTAFATTPLGTKPPFITTRNMILYIYIRYQIAHPQARLAQ